METLAMRAASAASATVPQPQFSFQLQHSLFPVHGFTLFHRNRTDSSSHLCCRTRHRHSQPFANKQHHLLLHEEPQEQEDEEVEVEVEVEEEEASYSDDDTSFLSLTVKPDRNMALLDDYETEELDFDDGPNHRSGSVSSVVVLNFLNFS